MIKNHDLVVRMVVDAMRKQASEARTRKAEVDISGGVDSAVVAALACLAFGKENVVGVYSSIGSSSESRERARLVAAKFGFKLVELDFSEDFEDIVDEVHSAFIRLGLPFPDRDNPANRTAFGGLRSCLRAPIGRFVNRMFGGGIRQGTAQADTFPLNPRSDLIGATVTVRTAYEDTLSDIARRTGLGYEDMLRANPGVDPWLPGTDADIVLPTQFVLPAVTRQGMVVNIAEYRLYYFTKLDGRDVVATFPVSIGRMDWATPIGRHRILAKTKRPTWYPPESIRAEHAADGDHLPKAIPPGADNPLGDFAMRLSYTGYLIHGTNKPVGIGMQVTHGCIRMYSGDIEWLFPKVPVGAAVEIVNQPYKFGWVDDALYLEVCPCLSRPYHYSRRPKSTGKSEPGPGHYIDPSSFGPARGLAGAANHLSLGTIFLSSGSPSQFGEAF